MSQPHSSFPRAAAKTRLDGRDTRRQAIAKLNAFGQKIGYPDKWIDYLAAYRFA